MVIPVHGGGGGERAREIDKLYKIGWARTKGCLSSDSVFEDVCEVIGKGATCLRRIGGKVKGGTNCG